MSLNVREGANIGINFAAAEKAGWLYVGNVKKKLSTSGDTKKFLT